VQGPFALLAPEAAECLAREIEEGAAGVPGLIGRPRGEVYWRELGTRYVWYKSLHIHVAAARALAASPDILSRVGDLIGQDLVHWGGQWVEKPPGKGHRWHADVECLESEGVTVWLALRNAGLHSGIKLIEGSHHFPTYPQALHAQQALDLNDDRAVLEAARTIDARASVITPLVTPGSFVVFAGRAWHATFNRTTETRVSLIFQFSPRGVGVRIPTTFVPPIRWHPLSPPTLALGTPAQR
jgi:ectoine hydroxylase-related dioxygenase (phytanoyl-CoA dioxygenase family)